MPKKTNLEIKYKEFKQEWNYETIVILHWWGWSSDSWVEFWEIISKNWFDVIIPDLPWFWETNLNYDFNLDEYAKVLIKFITELGLSDFILMGHSNWWAISIKIANSWLLDIKKLVLNNSAWIRKDKKRSIKRNVLNFLSKWIKKLKWIPWFSKLRKLSYKIIWSHDYINSEKNIHLKNTYLNVIKEDISADIKKINIDTLIIWWEKDTYTPLSDAYFFRNSIKKSKLCILDNETHWIHLKNPKRLIETFLKNI